MRKKLLQVCPLLLLSTAMWGAPMCMSSAALSVYDAAGFSCSFGGLTFSNFSWASSGNIAPPLTDADVMVSTYADITGGLGLSFNAGFSAASGYNLDFLIRYQITPDTTPITSNTLQIQGAGQAGNGSLRVTETMCINGTNGPLGPCNGITPTPLDVFVNSGGFSLFDTATFSGTVNVLDVVKDISVQGGSGPADASVSAVINTNGSDGGGGGPGGEPVPEPGPMAMIGSGLGLTALLIRRRRRVT